MMQLQRQEYHSNFNICIYVCSLFLSFRSMCFVLGMDLNHCLSSQYNLYAETFQIQIFCVQHMSQAYIPSWIHHFDVKLNASKVKFHLHHKSATSAPTFSHLLDGWGTYIQNIVFVLSFSTLSQSRTWLFILYRYSDWFPLPL